MNVGYYILAERKSGVSVNAYEGKSRKSAGLVAVSGEGAMPSDWKEAFQRAVSMAVDDFMLAEIVGTQVWEHILKGPSFDKLKEIMAKVLIRDYWPFWRDAMVSGSARIEISRGAITSAMTKAAREVF